MFFSLRQGSEESRCTTDVEIKREDGEQKERQDPLSWGTKHEKELICYFSQSSSCLEFWELVLFLWYMPSSVSQMKQERCSRETSKKEVYTKNCKGTPLRKWHQEEKERLKNEEMKSKRLLAFEPSIHLLEGMHALFFTFERKKKETPSPDLLSCKCSTGTTTKKNDERSRTRNFSIYFSSTLFLFVCSKKRKRGYTLAFSGSHFAFDSVRTRCSSCSAPSYFVITTFESISLLQRMEWLNQEEEEITERITGNDEVKFTHSFQKESLFCRETFLCLLSLGSLCCEMTIFSPKDLFATLQHFATKVSSKEKAWLLYTFLRDKGKSRLLLSFKWEKRGHHEDYPDADEGRRTRWWWWHVLMTRSARRQCIVIIMTVSTKFQFLSSQDYSWEVVVVLKHTGRQRNPHETIIMTTLSLWQQPRRRESRFGGSLLEIVSHDLYSKWLQTGVYSLPKDNSSREKLGKTIAWLLDHEHIKMNIVWWRMRKKTQSSRKSGKQRKETRRLDSRVKEGICTTESFSVSLQMDFLAKLVYYPRPFSSLYFHLQPSVFLIFSLLQSGEQFVRKKNLWVILIFCVYHPSLSWSLEKERRLERKDLDGKHLHSLSWWFPVSRDSRDSKWVRKSSEKRT